jgi:hypothetical protein
MWRSYHRDKYGKEKGEATRGKLLNCKDRRRRGEQLPDGEGLLNCKDGEGDGRSYQMEKDC